MGKRLALGQRRLALEPSGDGLIPLDNRPEARQYYLTREHWDPPTGPTFHLLMSTLARDASREAKRLGDYPTADHLEDLYMDHYHRAHKQLGR